MSASETLRIAHTARCKLQMAADRPDRNLRFILGHAFTLDKLRLRLIEIEEEGDEEEPIPKPTPAQQRRVSFSGRSKPAPSGLSDGRKSPPPPPQLTDDLEEDEDEEFDDEDEDDELSLRRFGSAAAQPPRIAGEDSSSSDEDDDPPIYSEVQLKEITAKQPDQKMKDAYAKVAGCPCHEKKAPPVENFWEVPSQEGKVGPRVGVVQVAAVAA